MSRPCQTAALCLLWILLPATGGAAVYNLYATNVGGYSATEQVAITTDADGSSTGAVSTTAIFSTPQGAINYPQGGPGSIGLGSSGSGTYTRLFAVQSPNGNVPTERGYNANAPDDSNSTPSNAGGELDWDQKSGVGYPKVLVKELTLVTYQSVEYFEFLFDGQENDNAISLDELLVFTAPGRIDLTEAFEAANPDPTIASLIGAFQAQGGVLRYSLDDLNSSYGVAEDNTILLETATGSGKGEVGFYLPVDSVTNIRGGNLLTNGAWENDRVYMWVQHGGVGMLGSIDFGTSSTFEEWAYFRTGVPLDNLLPEPSTTLGGLFMVGAALCMRRRNEQFA